MSTIKSSAENLTLNADGSGNDISMQSNASEKLKLTAEGNLHLQGSDSRIQLNAQGGANVVGNNTVHIRGDGAHMKLMTASGGNYIFEVNGTEELRVQSGGGISFNGDTAAANALDDYEEGTWSPSLIGATFANQTTTGRYVKIGNIVYIQYYTAAFNISSASGAARISNLPYAPLNVSGNHSVVSYTHGTAVIGASNIYLDHSNATMYFVTNDTTDSPSWTDGTSKFVMLTGTYQTA